ncbi:hypothetical protein COX86_00160 [Candidatus Micrarchaeota archaeon CG_4_10_14_0_2_um_filter_60_11]|nr:MAG: hypothetical protein COT58_03775 [Candidatus Micrarchaeota archaeon CG09_land_8_20_14_0_10_60_16]PIY91313.1 MAG: hypothetical protein COY71_03850 [Candidatus Micrarchaeota archaeon CG_4_10_14_0_8_um_filter_60_7]PIZ91344.1 MAG: hypothetical protein COX86_00160 [Candidatus Micrarchaeota archaeon CG_4_10_14_0_2_um_filter_60_11]
MKKLFLFLGVIAAVFLMGCASSSTTTPSTGAGTPSASLAATSTLQATAIGTPFKLGDLEITVKNVRQKTTVGSGYFVENAREGAKYVVFDAEVKNDGKESYSFSTNRIKAYDEQERKFDVALSYASNERIYDSIEPGLKANYVDFYVEVPQETPKLQLTFLENMFDSKGVNLQLDLSKIQFENTTEENTESS